MPVNTLPDLRTCLQNCSWRRLLATMEAHHIPCSHRWLKQDLVQTLQQHLLQPNTLAAILPQLSPSSQQLLHAFIHAEGILPAHNLQASFGALPRTESGRPRSFPDELVYPDGAPPASPAFRLWRLGLFYLDPPRPPARGQQQAVMPSELLPMVKTLLAAPLASTNLLSTVRPGRPTDLLWHQAVWLASIAAEPIRLLRGGWLPPSVLTNLLARLGLVESRAAARAADLRGERHHAYLAFLHYLAVAAGWVNRSTSASLADPLDAGGALPIETIFLTPAAWLWLEASTAQRWQELWQIWSQAERGLDSAYRFPWSGLSPQARQVLHGQLARLPVNQWQPLTRWLEQVRLHDVNYQIFSRLDTAEEQRVGEYRIEETMHTPLPVQQTELPIPPHQLVRPYFWLGVVDLHEDETQSHIRLTAHGAWLLQVADWGTPVFAAPAPATLTSKQPELITLSASTQPLHLARLAPYCQWQEATTRNGEQLLQLAAERIGRAAAAGVEPLQIAQALEAACGRPASRRLRQRLHSWGQAGRRVRLYPAIVLETETAALMGQLRSRQLVRRHLESALAPNRSRLKPSGVAALLQTLAAQGLYVQPPTPLADEDGLALAAGDPLRYAEYWWMLLALYRGLGKHVQLPIPFPWEVSELLRQRLSFQQRTSAESLAQRVLAQIETGLAGYLQTPVWRSIVPEVDPVLIIEQALAEQCDLQLTYWSGGRDEKVARRVTPYYLERRQGTLYLVAWCHLREADRVFRVDRVEACSILVDD